MAIEKTSASLSISAPNGGGGYTLKAYFKENSTSTTNNTSNITVTATFASAGTTFAYTGNYTSYLRIYWHDNKTGTDTLVATTNIKGCGAGGYASSLTASGTINATHNEDGTLSGYAKASYQSTNNSGGWAPAVGTYTKSTNNTALTTIARASTVSCTTANIGSAPTITISRASSSFTHTLRYAFGSLSGTIVSNTSSTSYSSWAIPTSFYAQIPNSPSGSGTIYCDTYSGSTLIGTKSCSFVATAAESTSKPTLNPTAIDTNTTTVALTGNNTIFIKGYSTIYATTGASARNSATLTSQSITHNGTTKNGSTATFTAGSTTISFSATDSRSYSTSTSLTRSIINYSNLTCNMTPKVTVDGEAIIKLNGNFFNASFGAVDNEIKVYYRMAEAGQNIEEQAWDIFQDVVDVGGTGSTTYEVTQVLNGLDYKTKYTFQAKAVDKLNTITTATQTVIALPVFDWGEKDFNFNVDVNVEGSLSIGGTNLLNLVYPVGSIYMSVNSTNPKTLFGGTWEQLKDRFLLGAGDTYSNGETGGKASHTLTVDEMPSHKHTYPYTNSLLGVGASSTNKETNSLAANGGSWSNIRASGNTMQNTGGGKAHENMPPYLVVYMWKRTA